MSTEPDRIENPRPEPSSRSSPRTLSSVVASVLEGQWPKVVILVFFAELALLFVDASLPLPARLIRALTSQNNQIGQTAASLDLVGRIYYIFSNNFNIASLELIPVYGWFVFNNSILATARSIAVIGIVQNSSGPDVVISLLLQPHTWLELPAYAIALTQGFYVIVSIFRRNFVNELLRTLFIWLVLAAELLVAAAFESGEITTQATIGSAAWLYALIAFFALVALGLFGRARFLRRHHERNPPQLEGKMGPTYRSRNYEGVDRPHLYDTITVLPNPSQVREPVTRKLDCPHCGAAQNPEEEPSYCWMCGSKL